MTKTVIFNVLKYSYKQKRRKTNEKNQPICKLLFRVENVAV